MNGTSQTVMLVFAIINIVAIMLSPVIAVLITVWVQNRSAKRNEKLYLFRNLMATRHSPITNENVRALNMIDVLFWDKPTVRRLWREYYEMLANEGLNHPDGYKQRQVKNLELLQEMARVLGYGNAITHLDVDRVYYPQGLVEQGDFGRELGTELLRVLRSTDGIEVRPRATETALAGQKTLTN